MKAVQLITSGDYQSHYLIDDHESWKEEVQVHEGYGLDRFEYRDIPRPEPSLGQVVVQIKACGLNHLDAWAAKAPRAAIREKPVTPGADMAGVVDQIGPGVTNVSVGDRVMVYPGVKCNSCRYCLTGRDNLCPNKPGFGSGWDGGLAEYALVPEQSIIPVPDNVSLIDAASMPIIFMTVWHMLVTRARVQPGDTVLVNAAGSGVGIAGIQIAKLFHARVIASAGSDPKLEKARKLGADDVINYTTSSIKEEVKRLTDGYGVDIVVDSLSGNLAEESIEALAVGGRFVNCGCTLGQLGNGQRSPHVVQGDLGTGLGDGHSPRTGRVSAPSIGRQAARCHRPSVSPVASKRCGISPAGASGFRKGDGSPRQPVPAL